MTYRISDAYLANKVYTDFSKLERGTNLVAPDGSQWKVVLTSPPNTSDYQGMMVKNEVTGEYKFVSRGTEPTKTGDLNTNYQMGIGRLPDQVYDARSFLQDAKSYISDKGGNPITDLSLTGHSLGGSITQVLGSENPQLPAAAFNPYGVGNLIPEGDYSNVTNYVMAKDPVSVLIGSSMIGTTEMYTEPNNASGDTSTTFGSHGISNFLDASVSAQTGRPVTIDVPYPGGAQGDPHSGMPWPGALSTDSDVDNANTGQPIVDALGNVITGGDSVDASLSTPTSNPVTTDVPYPSDAQGDPHSGMPWPGALSTDSDVDTANTEQPIVDELGNVISGGTGTSDSTQTGGDGGYMDANGVYHLTVVGTSTSGTSGSAGTAASSDANYVNGSDQQSDAATDNIPTPNDPFYDALTDAFQNPSIPTGPGITVADAGEGTLTDGGIINGYGGGSGPIISTDGFNPAALVDYVNGSDLGYTPNPNTTTQINSATSALNLANSFINGINNWGEASDLGRLQTAVNIYNQINNLSGVTSVGVMDGVGSFINFANAIENGDFGGIVSSGLSGTRVGLQMYGQYLNNELAGSGAEMLGMASNIGDMIPYVNLIIALTNIEDNPAGVLIAACAFIPVYGQIIAAVLSICQALFTSAPVSEGAAHASFDETGNLIITTDQDEHGGGSTANQWMTQLAHGAQLAGLQTPQAGAYTVGMPSVGYRYDPDGYNETDSDGNAINGYLTLNWTDANGIEHSRRYEGNGGGSDGFFAHNSIGEDFMLLMQTAQNGYPPLMYEQLDGGVLQLDYGIATVVYATNTQQYNGMAEHTHGGDEDLNESTEDNETVTIEAGDLRLVQDDSQTIANSSQQTTTTVAASSLHTVVNPLITPIQTQGDLIGVGSSRVVSNNPNNKPLGFVPLAANNAVWEIAA